MKSKSLPVKYTQKDRTIKEVYIGKYNPAPSRMGDIG
jgi:hypothetical protein